MAYITDITAPAFGGVANAVRSAFNSALNASIAVTEAQSSVKELNYLANLSDEQLLEKYGLKRSEVAHYILRDKWI